MTQEAAPPATTTLSMTQLAGVISRHFPPEARATAVAISWHESRGNARALNDKNNTPAGSRDRGLWQINDHWNPSVTDACAFDPECSTAWAAAEYRARGWKAWATFGRGAYRPFLEQAEAAVEQAAKAGGGTPGTSSFLPSPGDVIDAGKGAAGLVVPDSVEDAFRFIGRTFQVLVSPDFWKRIGVAGAGLTLVVVAVVIVKRDTISAAIGGPAGAAKKQAKSTTDAGADAAGGRPAEGVQAGDAARK